MPKTTKSVPAATRGQFDQYKEILLKKAGEVRHGMSASRASQFVSRVEEPGDDGDLSQQSHEEWIFLNRNTLEKKLLDEITDALRRIEQGAYGICMECEELISVKRLNAVPWAKYCVTCQEEIAQRAARGYAGDDGDNEA